MRVPFGSSSGFSSWYPTCQSKFHLPFEHGFGFAGGIDHAQLVILAAQVHVRLDVDQLGVVSRRR